MKEIKWNISADTEENLHKIRIEIEENRKMLIKILNMLEDYAGSQVEATRKLHSEVVVVK